MSSERLNYSSKDTPAPQASVEFSRLVEASKSKSSIMKMLRQGMKGPVEAVGAECREEGRGREERKDLIVQQ